MATGLLKSNDEDINAILKVKDPKLHYKVNGLKNAELRTFLAPFFFFFQFFFFLHFGSQPNTYFIQQPKWYSADNLANNIWGSNNSGQDQNNHNCIFAVSTQKIRAH